TSVSAMSVCGAKSNGSRSIALLRSYGGNRAAILQRRLEGVPRQSSAFDARGVSLDPRQGFEPIGLLRQQLGQLRGIAAGHPSVKMRKESPGLFERLALEHLGHQRGCGGRDRAAATLKRHIGDFVAVKRQIDRYPVAAQRVVAVGEMRRLLDLTKIARMAPMIE